MTIRFIHAADVHLDSPLAGLAAFKDAPTELLRTATRDAFTGLIDEALSLKVDFVVLAGDLYDGSWKDFNTGIYFSRQMGRLMAAGIPVFIVDGNHDAEADMRKKLTLPDNVRRFSADRPQTLELPQLRVALHGQSFRHAATTENLAAGYPPPKPGWLNIGVLHTALEGHAEHAPYAPCTRAELAAKGYQYFALGHVHEWSVSQLGGTTIAYPGNLQGRHIRECGARGALLVEADEGGIARVERIHTDVVRWERLQVSAESCGSMEDVVRRTAERLRRLPGDTGWSGPMAVRVEIVGATDAHGALVANVDRLRAEVLAAAAAAADDRLWIEKVKLLSAPREAAAEYDAEAVAAMRATLAAAGEDADFLGGLREELSAVMAKLEQPVADQVEVAAWLRGGDMAGFVKELSPDVMAMLQELGAKP